MPNPNMKGSGEAYQSWNSDQQTATTMIALAVSPDGLRPPVSASATSSSRSTFVGPLPRSSPCPSSQVLAERNGAPIRRRPAFILRTAGAYFTQPFSL